MRHLACQGVYLYRVLRPPSGATKPQPGLQMDACLLPRGQLGAVCRTRALDAKPSPARQRGQASVTHCSNCWPHSVRQQFDSPAKGDAPGLTRCSPPSGCTAVAVTGSALQPCRLPHHRALNQSCPCRPHKLSSHHPTCTPHGETHTQPCLALQAHSPCRASTGGTKRRDDWDVWPSTGRGRPRPFVVVVGPERWRVGPTRSLFWQPSAGVA